MLVPELSSTEDLDRRNRCKSRLHEDVPITVGYSDITLVNCILPYYLSFFSVAVNLEKVCYRRKHDRISM